MTKSVGIHEAKTHLSRLLNHVAAGEEITITRRGRAIARLVPSQPVPRRRLGIDRGRWTIPSDFDAPLPDEILASFDS